MGETGACVYGIGTSKHCAKLGTRFRVRPIAVVKGKRVGRGHVVDYWCDEHWALRGQLIQERLFNDDQVR